MFFTKTFTRFSRGTMEVVLSYHALHNVSKELSLLLVNVTKLSMAIASAMV